MSERMELIKAAGGLVWRWELGARRIAVIHRMRYGDEWTLPKGRLKQGEMWEKAAKREVCEEIGCKENQLKVLNYAGQISYDVEGKPKKVRFWNMTLEGEVTLGKTDSEVDKVRWLTLEKALELLAHPKERNLLKRNSTRESLS
jgi:ADP-ribose pyrophosphatase YjhB (NUDIX family)